VAWTEAWLLKTKLMCKCLLEPPATEPAEPERGRCYLIFSESNGGCFQLQWSMEVVEGALAAFLPREEVAQHRYTRNGGISELCRDVGGPNVKKFFGGWLSFVKMAHSHGGKLAFLSNLPKQPVAIYTNMSDLTVGSVPVGGSLSFEGVLAVAVMGAKANGFVMNTKLQTRMFQQVGERLGASLSWDGGGGAKEQLTSLRNSNRNSNRSSSSCSRSDSAVKTDTYPVSELLFATQPVVTNVITALRLEEGMRV